MSNFHEYKVSLSEGQKDKLRIAVNKRSAVSIKLDKSQLTGPIPLMLTQRQLNQIAKAKSTGVGLVLNLSAKQIGHMIKQVHGGFLPALAAILPFLTETVLPALLGGLVSFGTTKVASAIDDKVNGRGAPLKTGNRGLKKKPLLTTQEKAASGLFQFGVPYSRGAGLVPFGM